MSRPTDKGANAGMKVTSLVTGMVAGADSIDDMALLRHGGMGRLFTSAYAPSTVGALLRAFTFGHVRQLDAVASRFLTGLAARTSLAAGLHEPDGRVLIDVDDTIVEVHGYAKQGAGFGYSGVRGLNALLATVTTTEAAPVIVAQRLRKGSCGSARGAKRLVADALKVVATPRTGPKAPTPLVRMDSAFYPRPAIGAAIRAGADVSVTVRLDRTVKAAIATIAEDAWQTIDYTDAVFDEATGQWISRAEVAEIPFTAFAAQKKADHLPGPLIVRRIPDLSTKTDDGQNSLFDLWRFHAFFTTTDTDVTDTDVTDTDVTDSDVTDTDSDVTDTVTADKTHRHHAIIEQVHADLKNSALAHLPSGVFTANAAWLVLAVMAFNLTRAAATTTSPSLARATTATVRRKLIAVPARIASSARRLTLHLPTVWPWATAWNALFTQTCGPPNTATT